MCSSGQRGFMRFRRFQISILLVGDQVNRKRLWWKPRTVVRIVGIIGPVEIAVRRDITGSLLGVSYTFHVNGPSSIRADAHLFSVRWSSVSAGFRSRNRGSLPGNSSRYGFQLRHDSRLRFIISSIRRIHPGGSRGLGGISFGRGDLPRLVPGNPGYMERAWEGQNDSWHHPKIMLNGEGFGLSISAIFHNESGYWVWTGRLSG